MKEQTFLILTGDVNSKSNARIKEEIEKLGHKAEIKNPMHFVPLLAETERGFDRLYYRDQISEKSERLLKKDYAGVVTRIGGSVFEYGMYILRHFENMKIFVSAPAFGCENCSDKFRTAQLMSRAKIRIPRQLLSWYAKDPEELIYLIDTKLPIWGKQVRGSQGRGVFQLVEAISAIQALESFSATPLILQKDINKHKKKQRSDIRAVVIGSETEKPELVAYERISETADARSNFSIHKSGKPYQLTDEQKADCIKAARCCGVGIAGVDLIDEQNPESKSYGKSLFIEVNQNVGLEGVTAVTGVNVPQLIAEYVVRESSRKNPNRPFYDVFNETAASTDVLDYRSFAKMINEGIQAGLSKKEILANVEDFLELWKFANL
jgi:ribosomal protein S6--L-glutamate ligase